MQYAVLDVETTHIKEGEFPKTLFWGYADEKGYKDFKTTKELLKFLRYNEPHCILHHSNFDVLQLLVDGAPISIRRSHNSRLIRCQLYRQNLLNSFSVFPLSLASIFECFGFKKSPLTCPIHENETESFFHCSACRSALYKRNFEDCTDGLTCFLRLDEIFSRIVDVSPLERGTIAGTSFRAAVQCAGEPLPVEQRFLEAYRGGRVEVFNTQKQICDKFDINSSYPFSFVDCPQRDLLLRVRVRTNDFFCPLYDASTTESLLFPNGNFESWVYQSNYDKYIAPHVTSTRIKVLEKHEVDFTWMKNVVPLIEKLFRKKNEAKQNGDKAIETAAKLLLNSMYGRIGLKGESERARILDYFPDRDDATIYRLRKGRYLVFDSILRETKSNYAFAAFITDNARARLYRSFVGSNAVYGDTDSVFTKGGRHWFDKFETSGNGLGEWKFEGRDSFKALNVKDYMWGDEETRKGGKEFMQWTLKTLGSGKTPHKIERNRISELTKRKVLESGETVPLVVNR